MLQTLYSRTTLFCASFVIAFAVVVLYKHLSLSSRILWAADIQIVHFCSSTGGRNKLGCENNAFIVVGLVHLPLPLATSPQTNSTSDTMRANSTSFKSEIETKSGARA